MTDYITSDARFSIVPEWVVDAEISDRAVRLYTVLARYADAEHKCFPSRATLAERMRCSTASVDRAVAELESIRAITVKRRKAEGEGWTSNLYTLRISPLAPRMSSASPTTDQSLAPRVTNGYPHGCRTNDNQLTKASERDATNPPLGPSGKAAVKVIIAEGHDENRVHQAVTFLQENNYPVADFRIRAFLDGKKQPRRQGELSTLAADDTSTDWSALSATADPLTGEVPF